MRIGSSITPPPCQIVPEVVKASLPNLEIISVILQADGWNMMLLPLGTPQWIHASNGQANESGLGWAQADESEVIAAITARRALQKLFQLR